MGGFPVVDPGPRFDADGARLRRGGCSCGAVRFTLRGEPTTVGICHCQECRKASGAAFAFYADWPGAAFESRGSVRSFAGRSFCPACGSRLFHLHEGHDEVEIMLGALDEAPSDLAPTREGWIRRREPWLQAAKGAEQAREDPAKRTCTELRGPGRG